MLEYNRNISIKDRVLNIISTILVNMIVIIMATKIFQNITFIDIYNISCIKLDVKNILYILVANSNQFIS